MDNNSYNNKSRPPFLDSNKSKHGSYNVYQWSENRRDPRMNRGWDADYNNDRPLFNKWENLLGKDDKDLREEQPVIQSDNLLEEIINYHYDNECKQRALQRQTRHQEPDYFRSPTPPIMPYTDYEASLTCEKLKTEETFAQTVSTVPSYHNAGDHLFVDNNRQASSMMSTYNMVASVNTSSAINTLDGKDMTQHNVNVNQNQPTTPPNTPPIVHYRDREASHTSEKLKTEETFTQAASTSPSYYSKVADHLFIDNNRHALSMMITFNENGSFNVNQWSENRRDQTKNCKRDADCNGDRPLFSKRENLLDKDGKGIREEQPVVQSVQPASTLPSYNTTDHSFVDKNRHGLSMMSTYNMKASVNTPTAVSALDGMTMTQHNVNINQNQPTMPMAAGLDVQSSSSSMKPFAFMSIAGENMYGGLPVQDNMFNPPVKEVIQLSKCVLYPPNPKSPRPTTRERPLGCKTVFVRHLPEKITEEIIREIFQQCGTVETIRMSKLRNFCRVRFSDESFVEKALNFSGYRLKIENKDEVAFTGRLYVDYANAADDQYDYECKQRALQRQARHQKPVRSPTPPVVHYSDHDASLICEKLKTEETFAEAASILITWLEKGECKKRNASSFFSIIQSTHNHVKKLRLEKAKYEAQLNAAKKTLKKQLEGIIRQFTELEKIFKAASLQKCWDQFSKAQRNNIKMWKKHTEELKNAHLEELVDELALQHQEPEFFQSPSPPIVHYSDHEASLICEKLKSEETFTEAANILITWLEKGECTKKNASSFFSMIRSAHNHVRKLQIDITKYEDELNEAKERLKKQLEGHIRQFTEMEKIYKAVSLQKCWDQFTKAQRKNIEMWKKYTEELKNSHLEALINEREEEEMELNDEENNENETNIDVEQMKSKYEEDIHKLQEEADSLRCQLKAAQSKIIFIQSLIMQSLNQKIAKNPKNIDNFRAHWMLEDNPDGNNDLAYDNNGTSSNINLEKEPLFISLISTFLHSHTSGANIDYICSYVHQIDSTIPSIEIENLLKRYPSIFREDSTGVGASLEKNWHFNGF